MKIALIISVYLIIGFLMGVVNIALAKRSTESKSNAASRSVLAMFFWPIFAPIVIFALTLEFIHNIFVKVADKMWKNG